MKYHFCNICHKPKHGDKVIPQNCITSLKSKVEFPALPDWENVDCLVVDESILFFLSVSSAFPLEIQHLLTILI